MENYMIWSVRYWDDGQVETWFDSLRHEEFKSVAKEVKLLAQCGNMLRLPHSKALGDGLFELRERRYGYRIYYCFLPQSVVLLLHVGNKATQKKDINTAKQKLAAMKL